LRKSGAAFVSRIVSLLPSTVTPATRLAFPDAYASAPTMSLTNEAAGDCSLELRFRSITARNVSAVTTSFEGGASLKPSRTMNVYVLPSGVTFGISCATSGCRREPSGPALSG
jgi:hypothetical protein